MADHSPSSFNLVDDPWIPVLYETGEFSEESVQTVLAEAHRIRQIAASNPLDRFAILRFLLALLYWCRGDPDGTAPSGGEPFPTEWFSKLEAQKECFELLGSGPRFFQLTEAREEKKLPASSLIHEVPTRTAPVHFRHSRDDSDGLCLPCIAKGLIRLPAFTTIGGRGKSAGLNGKPPVYVLPLGSTLRETLHMAWRPWGDADLGVPLWEDSRQLPDLGRPVPLLLGLTWHPRRVWLSDPDGPEAACISCGRFAVRIRKSAFGGYGKGPAAAWRDPHVLWVSRRGSASILYPPDAQKMFEQIPGEWRAYVRAFIRDPKWEERIEELKNRGSAVRIWMVVFSTRQNNYLDVHEYEIPITVIGGEGDALENSLEVGERIRMLERRLSRAVSRGRSMPGGTLVRSVFRNARCHIDQGMSEFLARCSPRLEESEEAHNPDPKLLAACIARALVPGETVSASESRFRILRD